MRSVSLLNTASFPNSLSMRFSYTAIWIYWLKSHVKHWADAGAIPCSADLSDNYPWGRRLSSIPPANLEDTSRCVRVSSGTHQLAITSCLPSALCTVTSFALGEVLRINLPFRVKVTEPAKSSLWDFRCRQMRSDLGLIIFKEVYWWFISAYPIDLVIGVVSWLARMAPFFRYILCLLHPFHHVSAVCFVKFP